MSGSGSIPQPAGFQGVEWRTRAGPGLATRSAAAATLIALALIAMAAATSLPATSLYILLGSAIGVSVPLWLAASGRLGVATIVLLLYLALADGVLKLATGSELATLGRDALLYAIVIGALARLLAKGEPLPLPPLSAWVIAFCAVALIQLANPESHGLGHSLASLRQHLEFVPLFFIGYAVLQSERRMRNFLILLVAVTAANGVVSYVQSGLTPEQIAAWGPGYAERIHGTGSVASRIAFDAAGNAYGVRPFALGSDSGFGGILAVLAVPAALALLATERRPRMLALMSLLSAGVVLAVVTSQARVAVVGAVISAFVFLILAVSSRRALSGMLAAGVAALVAIAVVSAVRGASDGDAFARLEGIAPDEILSTTFDYRRDTFSQLPEYVVDFPTGAGLGTTGPAAGALGLQNQRALDSESEISFLLIELGIAGVIVFIGFALRVMVLAVGGVRRIEDPWLRPALAAVAAPLFALFVMGFIGATSTASPAAPYIWLASGVLSFWLISTGATSGLQEFGARARTERKPASVSLKERRTPENRDLSHALSRIEQVRRRIVKSDNRTRQAITALTGPARPVSIRTATVEDLRGIGMSSTQADRVLRYREEGRLSSPEDLVVVPGFTEQLLRQLKRRLRA